MVHELKPPYTNEHNVLQHVCQFLPPLDVALNCCLVSTDWYAQCADDDLWKHFIERELAISIYDNYKEETTTQYNWRHAYFGLMQSRMRWRRGVGSTYYDHMFKVLIIGDKKVGKSSVMCSLNKILPTKENISKISKFEMSTQSTTVVDITTGRAVKLQFYDSNIIDMATYVRVCRMYAIYCHAIVIVYNIGLKPTFFNAINKWYNMIKKKGGTSNIFLVGCKSDLKKTERAVTREEGELVADSRGMVFHEVSCTKPKNIEALLTSIANVVYRRVVERKVVETQWPEIIDRDRTIHIVYEKKILRLPPVPEEVLHEEQTFEQLVEQCSLSDSSLSDEEIEDDITINDDEESDEEEETFTFEYTPEQSIRLLNRDKKDIKDPNTLEDADILSVTETSVMSDDESEETEPEFKEIQKSFDKEELSDFIRVANLSKHLPKEDEEDAEEEMNEFVESDNIEIPDFETVSVPPVRRSFRLVSTPLVLRRLKAKKVEEYSKYGNMMNGEENGDEKEKKEKMDAFQLAEMAETEPVVKLNAVQRGVEPTKKINMNKIKKFWKKSKKMDRETKAKSIKKLQSLPGANTIDGTGLIDDLLILQYEEEEKLKKKKEEMKAKEEKSKNDKMEKKKQKEQKSEKCAFM